MPLTQQGRLRRIGGGEASRCLPRAAAAIISGDSGGAKQSTASSQTIAHPPPRPTSSPTSNLHFSRPSPTEKAALPPLLSLSPPSSFLPTETPSPGRPTPPSAAARRRHGGGPGGWPGCQLTSAHSLPPFHLLLHPLSSSSSPPPRLSLPQLRPLRLPGVALLGVSAVLLFLCSLLVLQTPPDRTTNAWGVHSFFTYAVHSTSSPPTSSSTSSPSADTDSSLPVCPPPTFLNETHLTQPTPHHRMAPLSWTKDTPNSPQHPPLPPSSIPAPPTPHLPLSKANPSLNAASQSTPLPSPTAPSSNTASRLTFTSSPYPSSSSSSSSSLSPSSSSSPYVPIPAASTFLISFPRSGNSMLRKLLEDATGVLTGSHYGDVSLYRAGLRGELTQAHTLLLKHHFLDFSHGALSLTDVYDPHNPQPGQRYRVGRYIYVIRNPLDALVSYWQYVQHHSHEEATEVDLEDLKRFIRGWLPTWAAHVRTFTATFALTHCPDCSSIVIRYEDLIAELHTPPSTSPSPLPSPTTTHPPRILSSLLTFLDYPLTRPCRSPPSSTHPSEPYRVKIRRSLVNPNVTVARSASYAEEVKALMTCDEWQWVERVAGLEMRALGYWPEEEEGGWLGRPRGRKQCERMEREKREAAANVTSGTIAARADGMTHHQSLRTVDHQQ